ncbi:MAG: ribonuclease P protein component [Acidimicrobiaceae bacterium]|nr:ribonuclease P protein component [Acidimicrobiaceae bacterium]
MERLSKRSDFEDLRRAGRRFGGRNLSIYFLERDSNGAPLVGFAISKRVGNAVVRNRIRRRLREISYGSEGIFSSGCYLVAVKPSAKERDYWELKSDMESVLRRIGVSVGK